MDTNKHEVEAQQTTADYTNDTDASEMTRLRPALAAPARHTLIASARFARESR